MLVFSLLLLVANLCVASAFNADSKSNVAVYWGQNSRGVPGSQESLATYCQSQDADIVILSFLNNFPDPLNLNFASHCWETFSDGVLHCPPIAEDIKTCQSLGKKVFLGLGGAAGTYGFTSDAQAESFAITLWNRFGEGSGAERPFDDALVDGFDFDIENGNPTGYAALVNKLREQFAYGSKHYYISAAPQCPFPDASNDDLLSNANVDFAFIQFYNNYCSVDGQFNWNAWLKFAQTVSQNSNIKLFLGLPGSATAAATGYISDLDTIRSTVEDIRGSSNFGGISLWDASQAFANKIDGETYIAQVKKILEEQDITSSSTTTSQTSTASSQTSAKSTASSVSASSAPHSNFYSNTTTSSAIASSSKSLITEKSASTHSHATKSPISLTVSEYLTTVSKKSTAVVTITSCSKHVCSTFSTETVTEVASTVTLTTTVPCITTSSAPVTVSASTSSLASGSTDAHTGHEEVETVKSAYTTVVTITSCSRGVCSTFDVPTTSEVPVTTSTITVPAETTSSVSTLIPTSKAESNSNVESTIITSGVPAETTSSVSTLIPTSKAESNSKVESTTITSSVPVATSGFYSTNVTLETYVSSAITIPSVSISTYMGAAARSISTNFFGLIALSVLALIN